jgi:hypothetical protein
MNTEQKTCKEVTFTRRQQFIERGSRIPISSIETVRRTDFLAGALFVVALVPALVLNGCSGAPGGVTAQQPQNLTRYGNASNPNASTALSVTTATQTGPYHIATWALDMYKWKGRYASAANVNRLLTYAEGGGADTKALTDCHSIVNGCKTAYYWDPNHVIDPGGSGCVFEPDAEIISAAPESWFIHNTGYSDASNRVYGLRPNGCKVWAMNANSTSYQSWWLSYLRANADSYDFLFADDDYMMLSKEMYFTTGGCSPWPSKCTSTEEIPDDVHMVLAHANLINAMSHVNGSPMKAFFQQVSFNDALDASAFTTTTGFTGITSEGSISSPAYPALAARYSWVLDEMAAVNAAGGVFLLVTQGNSRAGVSIQTQQRMLTTGFAWLGYKEGFTVVWPDLEDNTANLPVWPEDLIYPSQPLQSMSAGHADLEVATGVYRREFAKCYKRGVYFGPCASVVNANSSAITVQPSWLSQGYNHMVTVVGGDVLSGGTVHLSGAPFIAGTTTVQAGGAALLAP